MMMEISHLANFDHLASSGALDLSRPSIGRVSLSRSGSLAPQHGELLSQGNVLHS